MKTIVNTQSVNTFGDPANIPVIFIHGFPFDHTVWERQIEAFSDKYYCIAYDVRGFGQSYVGDGQYSLEAYTHDLFSIVHEMQIDRPVLVGMSTGGFIALRAIERDIRRFRGLMLCGTMINADDKLALIDNSSKINDINVQGVEYFLDYFLPQMFSDVFMQNRKEEYNKFYDEIKKYNARGIKGGLFAVMSRTDMNHFLPQIDLPCTYLAGEEDKIISPDTLKKYASKIKTAEFRIVPSAGHIANIENPSFFNSELSKLLNRIR